MDNNANTNKMTIFEWFKSEKFWTKVDDWYPSDEDRIFRHVKNAVILESISGFYGTEPSLTFESFMINPKRCYNTPEVRSHICHYLNYFEKFYDKEHELLIIYYRIKAMIDFGIVDVYGNVQQYTKEHFFSDIKKYVLSESIYAKVWRMNCDNYTLELEYKNKSNAGLQYTDLHGKYLMEISFMQNVLIPLTMHFIYKNHIMNNTEIEEIVLTTYNWLFERYTNEELMNSLGDEHKPADMFSKLYETTNTTMLRNYRSNSGLWDMSAIRGMDTTINSIDAVNTIIIQVMPKYIYTQNVIMYNFISIRNMIKYTVTEIAYEYDFVSLNSSKKEGEDGSSQFDKFEAHLIKQDEALYLQNKFTSDRTMEIIDQKFGPFDDKEIDFMLNELTKNGRPLFNKFQTNLIFSLFYNYFGDTRSPYSINVRDYIKLMLAAKRILTSYRMIILPYIISGNVVKLITRSGINKKEMAKLESSEYYGIIKNKYGNNPDIMKQILNIISNIISSDFEIIDYHNPDLNGQRINVISDYIIDEVLCFINLI